VTGVVLGQGLFQVVDRFGLLAPQSPLIQDRHGLQPGAEGRQVPILGDLPRPLGQCLGPVEGEHAAAAGLWVISVGEPGLGSGGFVDEGQRVDGRLYPGWKPLDVLAGLPLDLDQGRPFRLGLDHPSGLPIEEEEVVNTPVRLFQGELAYRHAGAGAKVQPFLALDYPACSGKLLVDLNTRLRLTSKVVVPI
jgi:hypothetical protein